MTKTTRARYTLEFKREAVRLVEGGQSIAAAGPMAPSMCKSKTAGLAAATTESGWVWAPANEATNIATAHSRRPKQRMWRYYASPGMARTFGAWTVRADRDSPVERTHLRPGPATSSTPTAAPGGEPKIGDDSFQVMESPRQKRVAAGVSLVI